jgi:hypothetical protein
MSDIVEKLLLRRADGVLFNPSGPEAADEIETLTARVAELEAMLRTASDMNEVYEGRLQALEAALTDIIEDSFSVYAIQVARAALSQPAQPAPSAWRPIDTAPTDGRIFLATEGSGMVTTYWHRDRWKKVDWGNPTHWMPLPPPPEKGGE